MEVRQATINDLEELVEIFNLYRVFYKQPSDKKGALEFLFDRFEHRESIIFLATVDNKIVGFTQLYPIFSSVSMKRVWLLNDLYVRESHRRKGIANSLLNATKEFAQQTKAKGTELSTAMDNKQAQSLYEQLGYEKDEEYYHYFLKI
jgi:ribosomal protein S18 acetylase RimI-like enzyme